MLRMAELCAGYGGLGMAARLAGWDVELAWYAETDRDAAAVMATHHPDATNAGDITTAQFSAREPVDVLAAGWPCTPVSGAGRRRGAADERWLWPDVARAVRVLRPAVFVGENVPGLLSIVGGVLFGGVLADLDALGYAVRWTTVGACRVGLCHHRHRVFIVATLGGAGLELDRWPLARRRSGRWEVAADTFLDVPGLAPEWPPAGVVSGGRVWAEPCWPCGAYGVALLPTPTARDGMSGPGHADSAGGAPDLRTILSLLPTPRASDAYSGGPNQRSNHGALALKSAVQPERFGRFEPAVRRQEAVMGAPAPSPTEADAHGRSRESPSFAEWMQGLPVGWVTSHTGRNPALRIIGNGIAIPAGTYALSLLLPAGLPEPAGVGRG